MTQEEFEALVLSVIDAPVEKITEVLRPAIRALDPQLKMKIVLGIVWKRFADKRGDEVLKDWKESDR